MVGFFSEANVKCLDAKCLHVLANYFFDGAGEEIMPCVLYISSRHELKSSLSSVVTCGSG
jgi:hypothetical protein